MDVFLGLKPQAESYCPFGAETKCSASAQNYRLWGFTLAGYLDAAASPLKTVSRPVVVP
jgi:hypothetical protein